ncbi:hypothetical protein Clacol_006608 [Clathrus columnatus]|uniref:Uncharacterized protein n=1 Tax=Clathrus columnatus TaxID=1419009 RepID=A0AAV5AF53_9AGAM|nr:hypothetical protein Clacol_006608 [Clathrus columnatus]
MPWRRCYYYDQDTEWRGAPKSKSKTRYLKNPSLASASSYTSTKELSDRPSHRYNDHQDLSSRIESSSLGARLSDPEDLLQQPKQLSESLARRISEPSTMRSGHSGSGWGSHAMNDVSSSTWASHGISNIFSSTWDTQKEDDVSWNTTVTKSKQSLSSSRPVPTAPASMLKASTSPTTSNQESALPPNPVNSGQSPTFNKKISISLPQPPLSGTQLPSPAPKPPTSVPPSPVTNKEPPAFSPKSSTPVPQSLVSPQQPSQPPPPPPPSTITPFPLPPPPQQSGQVSSPTAAFRPPPPLPHSSFSPALQSASSTSSIQRPTLGIRTSSVRLDPSLSTPTTATIQSIGPRSHSPHQHHKETMEKKDVLAGHQAEARLRMICKTVWYYLEHKKAESAVNSAHKLKASYKSRSIGEGARARLEKSAQEADSKARDARRELDSMFSRFLENELWPTSLPQDNRLELTIQQLQDLQTQVNELDEKVKLESSLQEDHVTAEQINTDQKSLIDLLDQLDIRQSDIEYSIDQRLRDLDQKQESVFSDLSARARMDEEQVASVVKLIKQQVNELSKQHEAFAVELSQVCLKQADASHEIKRLQLENEGLKKRLVTYEERDLRLRSEFQAFVDSFEVFKGQQIFNIQERIDQRLLDSMKTGLLTQVRERIDERFSAVRQGIEARLKSTREVTAKDFDAKYGPLVDFLGQFRGHLQSAMSGVNGDVNGDSMHE